MLWQLMENSLEELKLLQTVLVLLTTNTVVHDEALSKVGNLLLKLIALWRQYLNKLAGRGKPSTVCTENDFPVALVIMRVKNHWCLIFSRLELKAG